MYVCMYLFLGKIISRRPQILMLNVESNLAPKYAFVIDQHVGLRADVSYLKKFPNFLTLSLDVRIKPRMEWYRDYSMRLAIDNQNNNNNNDNNNNKNKNNRNKNGAGGIEVDVWPPPYKLFQCTRETFLRRIAHMSEEEYESKYEKKKNNNNINTTTTTTTNHNNPNKQ